MMILAASLVLREKGWQEFAK